MFSGVENTLGILNPFDGLARFRLTRHKPAIDLAPFIELHWIVRWDRVGLAPFEQEILPHPCVNMAFEAGRSAIHGIGTQRFVARLEGFGRVVGTKFRPGAFLPFAHEPMSNLIDRVVPLTEVFGRQVDGLETSVLSHADDELSVSLIEQFLRSREPTANLTLELVGSLVVLAQTDRSIAQAEDLARAASMSVRTLYRLFERYVGIGPKWIIRRARVQEAAERVASGAKVEWAPLAQELGYHDQAHLIRDFKAQVGFTPAAYAARCAAASGSRSP
jgi:AraC-like DNA-binding protein